MRKYILDFVFDEFTGQSKVVIDVNDDSMTVFELNEAIRDGELREEVTILAGKIFGEETEQSIRDGKTELVCLDDHPEERQGGNIQKTAEENNTNKKENLL